MVDDDSDGEEINPQETQLEPIVKCVHTYPLVAKAAMNVEIQQEAIEFAVTACEKYPDENEAAAKMIKEKMDKKFGRSWQVVVGEGFGFKITYHAEYLMYLFVGGNTAIIMWKCIPH